MKGKKKDSLEKHNVYEVNGSLGFIEAVYHCQWKHATLAMSLVMSRTQFSNQNAPSKLYQHTAVVKGNTLH